LFYKYGWVVILNFRTEQWGLKKGAEVSFWHVVIKVSDIKFHTVSPV